MSEPHIVAIEDLPGALASGSRLLGLDVGSKTIGLALSDVLRTVATPFDTIRRTKFKDDVKLLAAHIAEHDVAALVIGLPINLDGSEGPRAQSTRAFARNLAGHIDLPLVFLGRAPFDGGSRARAAGGRRQPQRRAEVIDKMAAAFILQGALDRLRTLARD